MIRWLLVCLILVTPTGVLADAETGPLTPAASNYRVHLGDHLVSYRDDSNNLSVAEVRSLYRQGSITQPALKSLQYGYSESALWFVAKLRNQFNKPINTTLEVRYPPLDRIDVYLLRSDGQIASHQVLGDQIPYAQRIIKSRIHMASLELDPSSDYHLLIRIESKSSLLVPMYLSSYDAQYQYEHYQNIAMGMFYGLALGLLFYNLFLLLIIKDIVYLYYIIYVAGYTMFMGSIDGLLYQFWPNAVEWEGRAIYIAPGICGMFLALFCRIVLQTKDESPLSDLVLRAFFWAYLVLTVSFLFLDISVCAKLTSPIVAVNAFSILIIVLVRFFQGHPAAFYFIFGMGGFCIGLISVSFGAMNLHDNYDITPLILKFGAALEMVMFSIALAQRISNLQVQNRQARIEHLKRMDKLKDDFLANTSHELRTPLNAIIGIADFMLESEQPALDEQTRRNLTLISSSGYRLANLVNDILDFSKLKEKDITLNKQAIDLRSMVDTVIALSKPLVGNKALSLVNAVDHDMPCIAADEGRIYQVLHNLVGNAIKFTGSGSITIKASVHGPEVLVSIRDTGIGIDKEKYNDIFRAFEQADSAIDREYGGTGLGLAITRQLVELHDGKIWVNSELGKGACFYFTLPATMSSITPDWAPGPSSRIVSGLSKRISELAHFSSEVEHNAAMSSAATSTESFDAKPGNMESGHCYRLLVVDDDMLNIEVLEKQLSGRDYELLVARSGYEALAILDKQTVDIVLLDVMMPGMSGYEVCEHIRRFATPEELPVIMITAKNQVGDLVEGFRVGANDFIAKPFLRDELLSRISLHLKLKDAQTAVAESERKFRTIFENALEGIFQLDAQGQFLEANPAMARMLGYDSPQELREKVLSLEDQLFTDPKIFHDLRRMLESKEVLLQYETRFIKKSGEAIWGSAKIHRIVNERGETLRFEGLLEDISDQKATEETLYGAYQNAETQIRKMRNAAPFPSGTSSRQPTTPAATKEVIDIARLISNTGIQESVVYNILSVFYQNAGELITQFDESLTYGELAKLRAIAHTLKGSAANICADRLHLRARALENACVENLTMPEIGSLARDLKQALEEVLIAISAQVEANAEDLGAQNHSAVVHNKIANTQESHVDFRAHYLPIIEKLNNALDDCEPSRIKRHFAELMALVGTQETLALKAMIDNFDYLSAAAELRTITTNISHHSSV